MISDEQKLEYVNTEYETLEGCIISLVKDKAYFDKLGWQDIADIIYEKYNFDKSRHWYYRNYGDLLSKYESDKVALPEDVKENEDEFSKKLLTLQKEKVKLSDERNQNRAYIRRLAREETIKEIAFEAVKEIGSKKILSRYSPIITENKNNEAILLLSDWHYGFEFNLPWNKFSIDIAKQRISTLLNETIEYCSNRNVRKIHVLNLSDLIAGRIHLTIRLESRIDVITQIMEASEILAEFLNELTKYFEVDYYSCDDNHSRLEPDKTQSLDLESLYRITDWYLRLRLGNSVCFHDNKYGEGIITLNVLGHNVAGVHGHNDKPQKAIEDISLMTRDNYDLICMAHLHHFSMEEKCGCRVCCNGSLMGTDRHASNLRLHSRPSQTIIVVSDKRVCEDIHIVEL